MALSAPAALIALVLFAGTAAAQVPADALRDANAAATGGQWARVSALVDPLLRGALAPADRAEAHRLAGLADFHQQRRAAAEAHFVAYLKLDLDARLDPVLYPPDVVAFFEDVRIKHRAELRPPPPRRYWVLNFLPPAGQIQNGHRTKAWLYGGGLGALLITAATSYAVLRSWCTNVSGPAGESATCDGHERGARALRSVNLAAVFGAVTVYAAAVIDGVRHYRRREQIQPFVSTVDGGGLIGISGAF